MDHYNRWVRVLIGIFHNVLFPPLRSANIRVTARRVEADLGRFSEAIYNRVTAEAKKQRFQGFRPGTIPPHIEPTYRAFAMDECARETIMEAMQQNNIKPFESARSEFVLENFNIPPTAKNKSKKKKSKKSADAPSALAEEVSEETKWRNFATMKEALDAGWMVSISASSALWSVFTWPLIVALTLWFCTPLLARAELQFRGEEGERPKSEI
jgi:Bacterial trigger factor protein (TF)